MNVLLISQCDKRALTESRRILDQFAERRGDRIWQTPITHAGLDTLRRLLRKTARKNTAVACHWIRGIDHSELLWIVGDASRFNAQGAVPTDTTTRNVLRSGSEDDWHTGEDIRLLAQLAALLHDLGKASVAFQKRLRSDLAERNLYRHEWVSLRLFAAFVGADDDETWLRRLADAETLDEEAWIAEGRYQRDGLDANDKYPFRNLPPLAAAVAWLVVTHHRLPVLPCYENGVQQWLGKRNSSLNRNWIERPLDLVAHDWNEKADPVDRSRIEPYWVLAGPLPVTEPKWRSQAARIAGKLLARRSTCERRWLDDPFVMHLARLCLMLADHDYSALPADSPRRVAGGGRTTIYANTNSKDGTLKQPLDEHLLGVARDAGLIAHALPGFDRYLPRLKNHRGLRKRSADPRFAWQDKASDAAMALREDARECGAFIINMASTGCGKTLANARILNALADPQLGLRATYALGLRTLTQQTGRSYSNDLHLSEDELAVLVGGSASRALFEFYEQKAEAHGSASVQDLIEEDSHILYEGSTTDHPLLSAAFRDPDIRKLISAPLLVCTVDHLAPATESLRAGRQIAPMLRLCSSDLVLDELDGYALDDLPALTRLVHWAGLLGARVVLSSATLPPSLLEGMYLAYRAGRTHFRRNRGSQGGQQADAFELPCLWVDEFGAQTVNCVDAEAFVAGHGRFVDRRAERLAATAPLRRAELVTLDIQARDRPTQALEFARQLSTACAELHAAHADRCPFSGKRVSFGIVRMANIAPLFDVARAWIELGAPEGLRLHLCVYHARFPLVQRSAIEHQLDTAFNRRGDRNAVYARAPIRQLIDEHAESDHLFVVLASPVCEVGRDWDADWAIAEPSSMRSLIQLAGRVQRHRADAPAVANVKVFDTNLRRFKPARASGGGQPLAIYVRPGFEAESTEASHPFRFLAQRLGKLLDPDEYRVLTALPRIRPRPVAQWQPKRRFVDMEHARMAASMLPRDRVPESAGRLPAGDLRRDEAAPSWRYPQAALTGVLPQHQPFREDALASTTLVFLPDDDAEHLLLHRVERSRQRRGEDSYVPIDQGLRTDVKLTPGAGIDCWGEFDLMALLAEQSAYRDESLRDVARKMATVTVTGGGDQGWFYHPWLGFTERK